MNCLLSTLYAFWKTNSPDQGDYCYLLVYCGSFWTLQLRLGHHCVRHLEAPQREPGSAWRHCVAEEGRHERVGKGNQSFRKGCGSCPGACTHPDPVFKSTLWAEKKLHFPLLYSHRICWSPVFYRLGHFRPNSALISPSHPLGCSPYWGITIVPGQSLVWCQAWWGWGAPWRPSFYRDTTASKPQSTSSHNWHLCCLKDRFWYCASWLLLEKHPIS